jgi:hypothetical protein
VVDWDGLENRCARKGTVGSNPTLSATQSLEKSLYFSEQALVFCEPPLKRRPFGAFSLMGASLPDNRRLWLWPNPAAK